MRRGLWASAVLLTLLVAAGTLAVAVSRPPTRSAVGRSPGSEAPAPSAALAEMVRESDAVVEVVVLARSPRYDPLDDLVYSFSTVKVECFLRGDNLRPGAEFVMRIRGGRDGRHTSDPSEVMPILVPGTRHLLFLKWLAPQERPELHGWYLTRAQQARAQILRSGRLRLTTLPGNLLAPWENKPATWLRAAVSQLTIAEARGTEPAGGCLTV